MSTNLSQAQSAQQGNRTTDGKYTFGAHAEPDAVSLRATRSQPPRPRASAVLHTPLTPYELGSRMSESGHVSGLIVLDQEELGREIEERNDAISRKMIGSEHLIDISYELKSVTRDGKVIVEVTGSIDGVYDLLEDHELPDYYEGVGHAEFLRERGSEYQGPPLTSYMDAELLIPDRMGKNLRRVPALPEGLVHEPIQLGESSQDASVNGTFHFEGGHYAYEPTTNEWHDPWSQEEFPKDMSEEDREGIREYVIAVTLNYAEIREVTIRRISENESFAKVTNELSIAGGVE